MRTVNLNKKMYVLKSRLALLIGILCTMPILGIPLGNRYISLFTIGFTLFFIVTTIGVLYKKKSSFKLTDSRKTYLLFLLWPIISYFVGLFYMPSEWHPSMTSYLIRVLEYIALTILLYVDNDQNTYKTFCRGLIIGISVNAIWSIFEAISWYLLRISLNDFLFGRFLNIGRDILIWNIYGGGIRVCGLNYDPAHLGGILPILLFYGLMRGNVFIIILSMISLAFSQSTTALLGCIVVFIAFIIFKKRTPKKLSISTNKIILTSVGVICFVLIIIAFGSDNRVASILGNISENVTGYLTRISTVYTGSSTINEPRKIYYTQAINKLFERGLFVSLFGSGLGTSMYPFRNEIGLFASGIHQTVTEIETNYIAYLFDLGLIGLVLYISLLIKGFKKLASNIRKARNMYNIVFFGSFMSIMVCSATYHYIFTAYHMLIFSFATVYFDTLDNNKKEVRTRL